jgi:hypothetical protein
MTYGSPSARRWRSECLSSYATGRPTAAGERYVQTFAGAGTTGATTHPDIDEYSFLAQGEWRLRRDLILNAGLRCDLQQFAKPDVQNPDPHLLAAGIDTSRLKTDTNNWGPRLGVAWAPSGRAYVVRAGYGLFSAAPSITAAGGESDLLIGDVSDLVAAAFTDLLQEIRRSGDQEVFRTHQFLLNF